MFSQKKYKDISLLLLLLLFVALNVYLLVNHINWRDEAQAWLLAKELSPLELFKQMKYEGHPCMWHLILMPFAKLGFPYVTMNIISLSIMTVAAWIFLKQSTFPIVWKALVLFSSTFVLFYPVISRSYCLVALIICLLAVFYQKRHDKPFIYGLLLALMVQTHIVMLPMAGIMSAFWFFEAVWRYKNNKEKAYLKNQILGLSFPLVSLILLILQVMGSKESSAFSILQKPIRQILEEIFYGFSAALYDYSSSVSFQKLIVAVFAVIFILIFAVKIKQKDFESIKVMAITAISILSQIVFYVLIYYANRQRYILIRFILIWMFWLLWKNKKTISKKIIVPITCVFACSLLFINYNFYNSEFFYYAGTPYSDSKNCAEFIDESIPEDAPIIVRWEPASSAILPYSDRDFFYSMESGYRFSFVTWMNYDESQKIVTYSQLCDWAMREVPNQGYVYIILLGKTDTAGAQLDSSFAEFYTAENIIYTSEQYNITDELYTILKIPVK